MILEYEHFILLSSLIRKYDSFAIVYDYVMKNVM